MRRILSRSDIEQLAETSESERKMTAHSHSPLPHVFIGNRYMADDDHDASGTAM